MSYVQRELSEVGFIVINSLQNVLQTFAFLSLWQHTINIQKFNQNEGSVCVNVWQNRV